MRLRRRASRSCSRLMTALPRAPADAPLVVLELPERSGKKRRTARGRCGRRCRPQMPASTSSTTMLPISPAMRCVAPDGDHHRRQREHDREQRTGDGRESPQQKLRDVDEIDLGFDRGEVDPRLEGVEDRGEQPANEARPARAARRLSSGSRAGLGGGHAVATRGRLINGGPSAGPRAARCRRRPPPPSRDCRAHNRRGLARGP